MIFNKLRFLFNFTFLLGFIALSGGQSLAQTKASSEILHDLNALNHVTRVLYIAAHPDDENTRLISYLTKERKVDVSYLSITRGDGGQNLVGTEIGDGLGLIRTNELLQARRVDGGHQYFTRAIDFGFSKTPEETLKFWDKEAVLSDMVWVIRKVKPDIIITRFAPEINEDRSTHGHHTASAQLALEAAEYAADPAKYPESVSEFSTHKTSKIFWNTSYWFYGSVEKMEEEVAKDPGKYIKLNVNSYLPLLGTTCSAIAAESRSQHKSQGFGSSPTLDEQTELLQLLKGNHKGDDLFAGLPTTWSETSYGKSIGSKLKKIISNFEPCSPQKSVGELLRLRGMIEALPPTVSKAVIKTSLSRCDEAIAACLGLMVDVTTSDRKYYKGEKTKVDIQVAAFSVNDQKVVLNSYLLNYLKDEATDVNQSLTEKAYLGSMDCYVGGKLNHSQPYWFIEDKTTGSYGMPKDKSYRGEALAPYPYQAVLKFTIDGKAWKFSSPVRYGHTDPVKGMIRQPIIVTPDVMLNLDQEVYIFTGGKSKKIVVETTTGKPELDGYVELNLPKGWKSEPAFYKASTHFKGEKQVFEFTVTPAKAEGESETANVRAMFKTETSVYTVGIQELLYDHIPNSAWFATSDARLCNIAISTSAKKIGYVMGAGDKVPEALKEMGYSVQMVTPQEILQKPISFDAVVIGIRAFNTLEDIGNIHNKLMDFVKAGGNVIVQYNTAHRLKSTDFGPYPITLSRDRVTEEDAAVSFLKRDHPVMKKPNVISEKDFDNWVQERGLYFPSEWDEQYDAILSMHDVNENPLTGSLLVASFGEGHFVYTGLSFFRELPAGVPGAYRLMANLIEL